MADQRSGNAKTPAGTADSEGQNAEAEALEDALTRLRVAYEQYFLGVDRSPPLSQHTSFRQRLERLKAIFVRSSATKFRIGNLAQKAATYERLWHRSLVEIENGTYRRDLFKARRRHQNKVGSSPATPAPGDAPASPPPPVVAGAPAKGPAAPDASGPQLTDARVKAIYDAYVDAKRRCNEDVSKLTLEALAKTLRKQVPDLLKRHQAQGVDFKVVIKDGKAVLRPVPK